HHGLSYPQTAVGVRVGQRSRLPRRHRALRAPVQPAQPSPHGLHRMWQFGGIFFPRSAAVRTGNRTPSQLLYDAPYFSDLRHLRRLPQGLTLSPAFSPSIFPPGSRFLSAGLPPLAPASQKDGTEYSSR